MVEMKLVKEKCGQCLGLTTDYDMIHRSIHGNQMKIYLQTRTSVAPRRHLVLFRSSAICISNTH